MFIPPLMMQILGPVVQREEALGVEAADVAGVQPPAAQRLGGGLRLVPVAGHHHVATHDDLAGLAGRERVVGIVDDAHLDVGARHADAVHVLTPPRIAAVGVVGLGQRGDGHRRLALPVDLGEARPEQVERVLQVGEVHRRAAVDDRLQVGQVGVDDRRVAGEALDHRRRGEERHAVPVLEEGGDLLAVDAAGVRHDARRPLGDVRQAVQAGAVGQRVRRGGCSPATEIVSMSAK